jgi:hypothetical protein
MRSSILLAVLLLSLGLASCGRLGARLSGSPVGRGCTMGFDEAGELENVMGTIERLSDDWVVLSESDGTTIWIARERVVWMRVEPSR